MPTNHAVSRRTFLAATAASTALALSAKSYARILGANDRIGVGIIGPGGMGMGHVKACKNLKEADNLAILRRGRLLEDPR
jgi:ornithine cyclodeaminase/alanine dehydrogenase-like protein (mu-crystallin family)